MAWRLFNCPFSRGQSGRGSDGAERSHGAAGRAARFAAAYPGKVILAGIDSCQRMSGVAMKLLAFERLLEENPVYRQRVVPLSTVESVAMAGPGSTHFTIRVAGGRRDALQAHLKERGIGIPDLITSDAHTGLKAALRAACDSLGLAQPTVTPGPARLSARLQTPKGLVELHSTSPSS